MQKENVQNPLLESLNKLILIQDIIPLKNQFILGYILKDSNNVDPQTIKQLMVVIQLIFDVQDCQIISKNHVLELIVLFSHVCENFQKYSITSIMDFYQKTIQQIVNDPDYLKNKYLSQEIKVKKNQPSKIQELKPISKLEIVQPINLVRNNSDLAQCPICLVQVNHQNISVLSCGHIIHKQCFQMCMKELILNKRFPLKCPFQECKNHIETQDIEEYLSKQLVQKYFQFTLHHFVDKNTKNMSWCPTPGCSNAFQFDAYIIMFDCAKCKKNYCLKCKTEAHFDTTCEQNQQMMNLSQEDKKFIQFAKGAKYKQCPKCKFWVQKNHGCCHMTCRCGYEFCYVCGGPHGGGCNCQSEYANYYGSQEQDVQDDQDVDIQDPDYDDNVSEPYIHQGQEQSSQNYQIEVQDVIRQRRYSN